MVRGGGETFDVEIAQRLQKLGCDVSFLTGIPLFSGALIPLPLDRSFTIRTPYTGWFRWDKTRGGWRVRMADFTIFEKRAAAWADRRQDNFDVVQVCELPTFVREWKRRGCRLPVVMRLTAPDFYDAAGAILQADAVIASGATMSMVRAGVRPDCVDVPNGVDADVFRPHESNFRAAHGIAKDEFVVLCVARFQSVKNHRGLIEAFSQFAMQEPKARLILAGSGPLESDVRQQCRALKVEDRVLFLGEVSYGLLPDIYAAADVVAIPSLYESFCFAALEAMASGLPLVVTDTEWVPRLIGKDQGGRVVSKERPAEMARVLMELSQSAELRRRMGDRNRREAVEKWGWTASAQKLLALYESKVGGKPIP